MAEVAARNAPLAGARTVLAPLGYAANTIDLPPQLPFLDIPSLTLFQTNLGLSSFENQGGRASGGLRGEKTCQGVRSCCSDSDGLSTCRE